MWTAAATSTALAACSTSCSRASRPSTGPTPWRSWPGTPWSRCPASRSCASRSRTRWKTQSCGRWRRRRPTASRRWASSRSALAEARGRARRAADRLPRDVGARFVAPLRGTPTALGAARADVRRARVTSVGCRWHAAAGGRRRRRLEPVGRTRAGPECVGRRSRCSAASRSSIFEDPGASDSLGLSGRRPHRGTHSAAGRGADPRRHFRERRRAVSRRQHPTGQRCAGAEGRNAGAGYAREGRRPDSGDCPLDRRLAAGPTTSGPVSSSPNPNVLERPGQPGPGSGRLIRQRLGEEIKLREQREGTADAGAWALVQRAEQARKRAEASFGKADSTAVVERSFDQADPFTRERRPRTHGGRSRWSAGPRWRIGAHAWWGSTAQAAKPWIERGSEIRRGRPCAGSAGSRTAWRCGGRLRYWKWLLNLEPEPGAAERLLENAQQDLETAVKAPSLAGRRLGHPRVISTATPRARPTPSWPVSGPTRRMPTSETRLRSSTASLPPPTTSPSSRMRHVGVRRARGVSRTTSTSPSASSG